MKTIRGKKGNRREEEEEKDEDERQSTIEECEEVIEEGRWK